MRDVIDLVTGYFVLKRLKDKGYIKESDFNLSFGQFITKSIKAIKNIEEVENNEIK